MTLAIDRNALAADLGGSYVAADGLIPGGIRTGEGENFRDANGPLIDNDPEGYGDRCTQAATELHQAGYTSAAAMEQLGTVTLLYGARDTEHNQAVVLAQVLADRARRH